MNPFINNQRFLFYMCAVVSIGGILYGYDVGVIAGALVFMQREVSLTDTQLGLIVGAVLGGGLIGNLLAGHIADYFGRRLVLIIASIIFIVGISLVLIAQQFLLLFVARILLGIGVGVISVAVPLYVTEIVPAAHRGKYVTLFQLQLTFGIMLAYLVDLFFTASGNWRAMFAIVLIPAIMLLIGAFFLPETPRWLLVTGKREQANAIINKLFNAKKPHDEINLLDLPQEKFIQLFSKKYVMPTCAAIVIAIFNQLTGINSFLQYAPRILKNAGLETDHIAMLGSLGIGSLNFIATFASFFLIDRYGRRPLLLIGILGIVLSELYLGLIPFISANDFIQGIMSLFGLASFIVFFAIGPGIVVWLAVSELFPTHLRGKAMGLCLFFNSMTSTILAVYFIPLTTYLGMSNTYFLFSIFGLGYFLLVTHLLPETKALTLEKIHLGLTKTSIETN